MANYHLILPDQLILEQQHLSSGRTVIMIESIFHFSQIPHHKMKLALIFSAMRHFALKLKSYGIKVIYVELNQNDRELNYVEHLRKLMAAGEIQKIISLTMISPSEHQLLSLFNESSLPITYLDHPHDIVSKDGFAKWAQGKKQLMMEYFYRERRRQEQILMTADGEPEGGKWNYDKSNRKPLKSQALVPINAVFKPDEITKAVIRAVNDLFEKNFGTLSMATFYFAVDHEGAASALEYFIKYLLPYFGDYQDAMQSNQPFLFHSVLAPYLNIGLLDPKVVCRAAEHAYKAGNVPLNAAEGFIRQIIGWREFIKGIYWYLMPEYEERNALEASQHLPEFYWSGDTDLNCVQQVVSFTKDFAYSHHIQRLMVTGNLALLAGFEPKQVNAWYLAVYADAWQWVELPNTHGMALYADGGVVGTKPYVASGAYINRMSNYCKNCKYNVKQRTGPDACPFNVLYWHFLLRYRERFKNNNRMAIAYANLKKIADEEQAEIMSDGDKLIAQLSEKSGGSDGARTRDLRRDRPTL